MRTNQTKIFDLDPKLSASKNCGSDDPLFKYVGNSFDGSNLPAFVQVDVDTGQIKVQDNATIGLYNFTITAFIPLT